MWWNFALNNAEEQNTEKKQQGLAIALQKKADSLTCPCSDTKLEFNKQVGIIKRKSPAI